MSCKWIWTFLLLTLISEFVSSSRITKPIPVSQSKYLKRNLNVKTPDVKENLVQDSIKGETETPDYEFSYRQLPEFNTTNGLNELTGSLGSLGSSAILALAGLPVVGGLAKASLLALPFQIKEILLRPLILVALLLFLLTGAAYFACNVVNCSSLISGFGVGDIAGSLHSIPSHTYGRRSDENLETLRPIIKALENGYNKYK